MSVVPVWQELSKSQHPWAQLCALHATPPEALPLLEAPAPLELVPLYAPSSPKLPSPVPSMPESSGPEPEPELPHASRSASAGSAIGTIQVEIRIALLPRGATATRSQARTGEVRASTAGGDGPKESGERHAAARSLHVHVG
jgi:hypothetical protein